MTVHALAAPARGLAARVLRAGAVVGALDGAYVVIVYALILRVTTAPRIFQGIASRLLGPSALEGGTGTALIGLAMHFGVAFGWTIVFALLYRSLGGLRRLVASTGGALAAALAYGTAIWLIMNRLVVPALGGKATPVSASGFWIVLAAHLTVVGPPIVWMVRDRRAGGDGKDG